MLAVKSDHLWRVSACRSTSVESSAISKVNCCLVMAVHFHTVIDVPCHHSDVSISARMAALIQVIQNACHVVIRATFIYILLMYR